MAEPLVGEEATVYPDERRSVAEVCRWIYSVAPEEGRALWHTIHTYVPCGFRWPVLRRYIILAERLIDTPDADANVVQSLLTRACLSVELEFDNRDPIWS